MPVRRTCARLPSAHQAFKPRFRGTGTLAGRIALSQRPELTLVKVPGLKQALANRVGQL